jgi:micrococcal nuclease
MSRKKKIGLGIVAVLFVVGAAGAASPEQPAPAVAEQTISATATATALPKPSPATPSPTVAPTPAPTPLVGIVTKVVDGDTIRVDLPTGVETVRIIGIDTPETVDHNRPEACFGAEASAFARASLEGKSVTLEIDPTQDDHDRYDRLLAHIHVGDALYAAEAIGQGFGIHYVYERPSIHASELAAAQAAAKAANVGIWATCQGRVDLPLSALATPTPKPTANATPKPVAPAPTKKPAPKPAPACHPSYDPCLPIVGDLDCPEIGHQVSVIGPDDYRLDRDHDGIGCDSY